MRAFSLGNIIKYSILILFALFFILPFLLVISVSVSDSDTIFKHGYTIIPRIVNWEAYATIFSKPTQLLQSYKVTIVFSMLGSFLAVLVQSMIAYPLSSPRFKMRKAITVYIFITMLFSGGLVPTYILNSQYLKLNNSFWIYIFPSLVSAWFILIIRTFFAGLPAGLTEAAKIDGASEFRTFFQIVLPLSTPVLATVLFMTLINKWNDWYTTLIYIRKSNLYSLQFLLQRILRETEYLESIRNTAAGAMLSEAPVSTDVMKFAMAVLAAGPMLVVFPFFQKYFARGLTVGGLKG